MFFIFKYFSGSTPINLWKSNGMPEENIKNITKSDRNFAPIFVNHHILPDINFSGHCLINNDISIPKKIINLYIFYALNLWLRKLNTSFILNDCLFGSVKLTKNADLDKYKYSGRGIYSRSEFSFKDGNTGKKVDLSSSVHIDNKI